MASFRVIGEPEQVSTRCIAPSDLPTVRETAMPGRNDDHRPVPKRTWRHARYGDTPEMPEKDAPQDRTFSEENDAVKSGDQRPQKP